MGRLVSTFVFYHLEGVNKILKIYTEKMDFKGNIWEGGREGGGGEM